MDNPYEVVRDIQQLKQQLKHNYLSNNKIDLLFYPDHPQDIDDLHVNLKIQYEKKKVSNEGLSIYLSEEIKDVIDEISSERQNLSYFALTFSDLFNCAQLKDNPVRRILIEGQAGMGKSTLCKRLACEWARGTLWQDEFDWVFWIPLREITSQVYNKNTNLLELIENICLKYGPFEELNDKEKSMFQMALRNNPRRILWLLDGFDELDTQFIPTKLWQNLRDSSSVIITSRSNYFTHKSQYFCASIDGFNFYQVNTYIDKFFARLPSITQDSHLPISENQANQYKEKLCSIFTQHNSVNDFAKIPIVLMFACSIVSQGESFTASNLSGLFHEISLGLFRWYLKKLHPDWKMITEEVINEECEVIINFLERLAFIGMRNNHYILNSHEIDEACNGTLNDKNSRREFLRSLDKNGFLKIIPVNQCCFSYRTFQEYFAARYIAKHFLSLANNDFLLKDNTCIEFIQKNKYELRYEYVWWFIGGILGIYARHNNKAKHALNSYLQQISCLPHAIHKMAQICLTIRCYDEAGLPEDVSIGNRHLNQFKILVKQLSQKYTWGCYQAIINCLNISSNELKRRCGLNLVVKDSIECVSQHGYIGFESELKFQLNEPTVIETLKILLYHDNDVVITRAIDLLAKLGIRSHWFIESLKSFLGSKNKQIKKEALDALARLKVKDDWFMDVLLSLMVKRKNREKEYIINILLQIDNDKEWFFEKIKNLFISADNQTKILLTKLLYEEETKSEWFIDILYEWLNSADFDFQIAACELLSKYRIKVKKITELLFRSIEKRNIHLLDVSSNSDADELIGINSDGESDSVEELTYHDDSTIDPLKSKLLNTLLIIKTNEPWFIDELRKLIQNPDHEIKGITAALLKELGVKEPWFLEILREWLYCNNRSLITRALNILDHFNIREVWFIEALWNLFESKDREITNFVDYILPKFQLDDKLVIKPLYELLVNKYDPNCSIKYRAAWLLDKFHIKEKWFIGTLQCWLRCEEVKLANLAAYILTKYEIDTHLAIKILCNNYTSNGHVDYEVDSILTNLALKEEWYVNALRNKISRANDDIKIRLIEVLIKIGVCEEWVVIQLVNLIKTSNQSVAKKASDLLFKIECDDALFMQHILSAIIKVRCFNVLRLIKILESNRVDPSFLNELTSIINQEITNESKNDLLRIIPLSTWHACYCNTIDRQHKNTIIAYMVERIFGSIMIAYWQNANTLIFYQNHKHFRAEVDVFFYEEFMKLWKTKVFQFFSAAEAEILLSDNDDQSKDNMLIEQPSQTEKDDNLKTNQPKSTLPLCTLPLIENIQSNNNISQTTISKIHRTPCSFIFAAKKDIVNFLEDRWERYSGEYKSYESDNEILQKNIGNILLLSKSDIQNVLQAVRLKALGQILGLAGHAVEAQKLPQKTVDIIDIKTGETKTNVTIPDFNDENIVNFANWHQLEYLLYNLCFLVECHIQIQKGLIQEKALPITKSTLLIALEHEIWITINAYNLRKAYEEILEGYKKDSDKDNNKERYIKLFSEVNSSFIKAIRDSNETEFEFCLPCGSKDHAMYINFVFDKNNQELTLRIDNSSEEEPTVYELLDLNKAEQIEELNRYMSDVGFALNEKNNTARAIIYNEYDDYSFKKAKHNTGYKPLAKQQAPNCVVEGYWRGMLYRVEDVEQGSADKVFNWYFNYLKQYAVMSHASADAKTRHRNLRKALYDKLAIEKKALESNKQNRQNDENRDYVKQASKYNTSVPRHLSVSNQNKDSIKTVFETQEKHVSRGISPQITDNKSQPNISEPIESLQCKELLPQQTAGHGDCACHAIFGKWDGHEFVCDDVVYKRKEMAKRIRACSTDPVLYNLVKEAIKALIMENRSTSGVNIKMTQNLYQQYTCSDQKQMQSAWDSFNLVLERYPAVIEFINDFCKEYCLKKNISLHKLTLKDKFQTCLNECGNNLRDKIVSISELNNAFMQYNNKYSAGFDWEPIYTNLLIINEYAEFIEKKGNWLIPVELQIISYVFNITINYYIKNHNTPFTSIVKSDTYNPGKSNSTCVCFNGINHYERMASQEQLVFTQERVDQKPLNQSRHLRSAEYLPSHNIPSDSSPSFWQPPQVENREPLHDSEKVKIWLREILSDEIKLGTAISKGDCFFDAIAQGLNQREGKNGYDVQSLRILCDEYAKDPKNKWVEQANKKDREDHKSYLVRIRFTANELEKNEQQGLKLGLAVWGRPKIEGRIFCEKFVIKLHVIEIQEDGSVNRFIVDGKGEREELNPTIDYSDVNLIHIVNYHNLYVPLIQTRAFKQEQHSSFTQLQDISQDSSKLKELSSVNRDKPLEPLQTQIVSSNPILTSLHQNLSTAYTDETAEHIEGVKLRARWPMEMVNEDIFKLIKILYQKAKQYYQQQNISQLLHFYIEPDATELLGSEARELLNKEIKDFLSDKHKEQKVLLLLGDSGAGKSLFTARLEHQQWQELTQISNYIPLRIELKAYNGESVKQCIKQTLIQLLNQVSYQNDLNINEIDQLKKLPFLFILDGYDEIAQNLNSNLYTENHLEEWPLAKVIITCRTQYFASQMQSNSIFMSYWNSNPDLKSLKQLYLAPFNDNQIESYLEKYLKEHPEHAKVRDYLEHIKELLSNPFILKIFCDALPLLLEKLETKESNQNSISKHTLTRLVIYQAFMQYWFIKEEKRIEQSLMLDSKYKYTDIKKSFICYAEQLAYEMFSQKTQHVVYEEAADEWSQVDENEIAVWKRFFSSEKPETIMARQACPLRIIGINCWSFVHKSFQEYFIASLLWKELEKLATKSLALNSKSYINQRLLPEEPVIIEFIVDYLNNLSDEKAESMKQQLINIVMASKGKDNKVLGIASANAITILNYARVSLSGEDFSDVCIKGADLRRAILHRTNFMNANLREVKFNQAYMAEANLNHSQMKDVQFGELPYLKFDKQVMCLNYSSDGETLAVGQDNEIVIIEVITGKQLHILRGHSGIVTSIAFNKNGTLLVSGSNDNSMRIWDVNSGNELQVLSGHSGIVCSVAFSIDGTKVASGSYDKNVRLWDARNGEAINVLQGHTDIVNSIAFNLDGTMLASGGEDMSIRLWDVKSGKESQVIKSHSRTVTCVAFSPDGKRLASGSYDKTIRFWNVNNGNFIQHFQGNHGEISSIAFSPNGAILAMGSVDTSVCLWDVKSGKELQVLQGHENIVSSLAFSQDSTKLVSGSLDNSVRFWEVKRDNVLHLQKGHISNVYTIANSNDGTKLASGSRDKSIRLWDLKSGKVLQLLEGHNGSIYSLAFSYDDKILASGSDDHGVKLWEVNSGKVLHRLHGHTESVYSVVFSPDGTKLASGSWDSSVRLWDVKSGSVLQVLIDHYACVKSLAFSPDGAILASGGDDKKVLVWDVKIGKRLPTISGYGVGVKSLMFSPDSEMLALAGDDSSVWLWDVKNNRVSKELNRLSVGVKSISFSPDCIKLILGSDDKTIRIWDIDSNQCMAVIANGAPVLSVSYSKHGQLISGDGSPNNAVRLWQLINNQWHLKWSSPQQSLCMAGCIIIGVKDLSDANKRLIEQRSSEIKLLNFANSKYSLFSDQSNTKDILSEAIPDKHALPMQQDKLTRGFSS